MLPSPDSLASRLFSGPLRLPSGAWMSWVSDDGTGFPYPEATALAVRTAIWWHRHHPGWPLISLIPELRFLEQSLDPAGIVVQRDRGYLFDTAIVLAAMADADAAGVPGSYHPLLPVLRTSVATLIAERKATVGGGSCGPTWSASFGPHQLKALALAVRAGALPRDDSLVDSVLADLLAMQRDDGGFYYPGVDGVLLHAHCYALEGLCMLTHGTSGGPAFQALEHGLAFLARQQGQDGTFPARAGPPRACQTEGSSRSQQRDNLTFGPLPGCRIGARCKARLSRPNEAWQRPRRSEAATEQRRRWPRAGGQGWAGDVTAQAARLLALDHRPSPVPSEVEGTISGEHRPAEPCLELVDRGLARCLAPCGLVRYGDGLDHRNSWASLFALQYLWVRSGGNLPPEDLI